VLGMDIEGDVKYDGEAVTEKDRKVEGGGGTGEMVGVGLHVESVVVRGRGGKLEKGEEGVEYEVG
jgi:hypothetical protein